MNYKRIVAAHINSGTVFELEDGMFCLVDHELFTDRAKYAFLAENLIRDGYWQSPKDLPDGNCDEDIAVLKSLTPPDEYYGFGKERYDRLFENKKKIEAEMAGRLL